MIPFTNLKKLIKDLIVRLNEEANKEAEHRGWCFGLARQVAEIPLLR